MAEDLAYLGQQEPKLTLCPLGVINAYSKDNLATPQVQIDLRQHLAAAWPVLLDQLREQGIPIPQQLATPHFFGASETACVTTTRKALEVSAWIYKFSGNESITLTKNETQGDYFVITINNVGQKQVDANAECPAVMLGYDSVAVNSITWGNGNNRFAVYGNRVYIRDLGITTVEQMKAKITGQYLIYELADPIRIQYSDLGLPDINSGMIGITTDHILTLSDTDGLEMHRLQPVEWTDEEGNIHPALITRWSQAYMDKHHAWPPALTMTFTGLQFTADYKEMRWLHDTVLKLINKYPV